MSGISIVIETDDFEKVFTRLKHIFEFESTG